MSKRTGLISELPERGDRHRRVRKHQYITFKTRALKAIKLCGLSGVVSLAIPLSAMAQSATLTPVLENPSSIDGPNAYRIATGQDARVRCVLFDDATGQEISPATRLSGTTPEATVTRGPAAPWRRSGLGPHSVPMPSSGLNILECRLRSSRPGISSGRAFIVAEDVRLRSSDIFAYFARPDNPDPVSNIATGEDVVLHIRGFDPGRTTSLPVSLSELAWQNTSNPCNRRSKVFGADTVTRGQRLPWTASEGLRREYRFLKPGTYRICARVPLGDGSLAEKSVRLKVGDFDKAPEIAGLTVEGERFGLLDTSASRDPKDRIETYKARAVIIHDTEAPLQVTIRNQFGEGEARQVSRSPDRTAFEADLPFGEGLQIVKVTAKSRGVETVETRMFVAAREMLSVLQQSDQARLRRGMSAWVTSDIVEDSQRTAFVPTSIEAEFKAMSRAERVALFPEYRANVSFPVDPVADPTGTVPAVGNFRINNLFTPTNLDISLDRGERYRLRLGIDFDNSSRVSCERNLGAAGLQTINCPLSNNGTYGARVVGRINASMPLEFFKDRDRRPFLAFEWDDFDVNSDLNVTTSPGIVGILLNQRVVPFLDNLGEKDVLKERLFRCTTSGSTTNCNPSGPFEQVRGFDGKLRFGIPLSDDSRLIREFAMSSLLDNRPLDMEYFSFRFDPEMERDFLGLKLNGAITPKSVFDGPTDYARIDYSHPRTAWPERADFLRHFPQRRQPEPNAALAIHMDTLNAYLTGLAAAGAYNIDLPAPEFAALLANEDGSVDGTPFAALTHFPNGRVRLFFERAPRLAPRSELADYPRRRPGTENNPFDYHALELGPIRIEIDLSEDAGSRLVMELGAILPVNLTAASVAPPDGLAINLGPQGCNLDLYTSLGKCGRTIGVTIVEREGFHAFTPLPDTGDPEAQARLKADWTKLRKLTSTEPILGSSHTTPSQQGVTLPFLLGIMLTMNSYDPLNPTDGNAISPIDIDSPFIPLMGPIFSAMNVELDSRDRQGIGRFRPHEDYRGFENTDYWLGLVGEVVSEPVEEPMP